jgi:hypothetical protein
MWSSKLDARAASAKRDGKGKRTAGMMAHRGRFELPTPRFVVWCSIQLSYRCLSAVRFGLAAGRMHGRETKPPPKLATTNGSGPAAQEGLASARIPRLARISPRGASISKQRPYRWSLAARLLGAGVTFGATQPFLVRSDSMAANIPFSRLYSAISAASAEG